jgi:ABC-type thiamine transport system substrate-binding protein
VSINTLVVPKGSKHKGCAEAFVAFMLGEESQTAWATQLLYGSSSSLITFPDALSKTLYPAPGSKTIVPIDWGTIAKNSKDTLDIWNRKVTS